MLLGFYNLNSIICLDNNKVSAIFTRMRILTSITIILLMVVTETANANSLPPTCESDNFFLSIF